MVNLLRCVDAANVCVAVLDVTDTTILEHVFVMLAVETEVDMDAIRISLTAPTSTSWLTADSPDLLKPITSLGLPTGPCESTIHVRLSPLDAVQAPPVAPAEAQPQPSSQAPANAGGDAAKRVLDLFGSAPARADSHSARTQARSEAGPAHVDLQSSPSVAAATGKSADQRTAKLIEEMEKAVRQREIDNNLLTAMEYTPEAFTRLTMLYVDCEINRHPVKAFVDSGAQMSIMNVATAKRCGVMRLLDTRMKGEARGVGRQVILGRIHFVTVNLAGLFIPFSFSVLEDQDIDIIIGLDQMRRHLMQIDLKHNCLRIEDIEVPFLPESQLPERAKLNVEASTMVEAPKPDNEATTAGQEQRAREGTGHGKAAPAAPAAASASQAGGEPATAPAPARQAESLSPEQHAALDQLTTLTGGAYPRAALIAVLEAAGWNVETAATLLFEES